MRHFRVGRLEIEEIVMRSFIRKSMLAAVAIATVAGTSVATSGSAEARYYHRGGGWGWAGPAIVGGLALGALAASRPYYGYGGYYPAYGYDGCLRRRVVGYTPYGRPIVRTVNVCY
jgi:hypothetical protein